MSLVNEVSSSSCDVSVYNLKEGGMDKAREYGVTSVPTVVVDGQILDCCRRGKPTAEDLRAAGIGSPP
ncbi:MAG TPA: hypothetical protein VMT71_14620 [Syntrophorhabdales bacterium]|nr:hypothetical protein [Syntrophorhabdales bacterium]